MFKYLSGQTKRVRKTIRNLLRVSLGVTLILGLLTDVVNANVRSTIPPDPYAPIYLDWYGDNEWVAFIFYRPPECVRDDFNFWNFFDIPYAFFCSPLTVKGFVIYQNPGDLTPRKAQLTGLGEVPVWFVSRPVYDYAMEDLVLTIGELEALPTLMKGHATFFKETRDIFGVHPVSKVNIVAEGILEDSLEYESFWFQAFWLIDGNVNVNIKLE